MSYIPTPNSAASIKLHLAVVNTPSAPGVGGVAVSLTGNTITVDPATGFEFATTDANCIIQVLGAGTAGAPLWTTVSSVSNPTTAHLASANTAVTHAQAVLYRPLTYAGSSGVNYVLSGSITFESALTTSPTLNFSIISKDGSFEPVAGMPVLMTDSDSAIGTSFGPTAGDIFGGSIEQVKKTNYPGNAAIRYDCECVSWDAILSRRVLGNTQGSTPAFPTAQTPISFNGGLVQSEPDGYGHTVYFFSFNSPNPLKVVSATLNGVNQSIGPFGKFPWGTAGPGQYQWYWGPGVTDLSGVPLDDIGVALSGNIWEDPSGPVLTSGDVFTVIVETATADTPTISKTKKTPDVIALELLEYIREDEGISVAYVVTQATAPAGVTIPLVNQITFTADQTLAAAFSSLTTYVNDGTDTYRVWMDPRKGFHFDIAGQTAAAPWNINEGDGSDGNVLVQVQNTTTREKFANAAWLRSSKFVQQLTEDFTGDNSSRTFSTTYNIGAEPTIVFCAGLPKAGVYANPPAPYTFGSPPVLYPKAETVGVAGGSGAKWYWSAGSNQITQDTGEPILSIDSVHKEMIFVTYQPQVSLIQNYIMGGDSTVPGSPAQRALVEGGSGQYDTTIDTSSQLPFVQDGGVSLSASQNIAQVIAQYYSQMAQEVAVQTYRSGLAPGQSITVNLPGINSGVMVVQSVRLSDEGNIKLWDVTIASGALIGDWKTAIKYFTLGGTPSLGGFTNKNLAGGTLELGFAGGTGPVGVFMQANLIANGGLPPDQFSIVAGSSISGSTPGLPPGMTLAANTGQIYGTPSVTGTYTFSATVKDSTGTVSAALACTMTIQATPGSAGAAPNVTSSTLVPIYRVYNGIQHWQLSGVITLPIPSGGSLGDPIPNLDTIHIELNGPQFATGTCTVSGSGNWPSGGGHIIATGSAAGHVTSDMIGSGVTIGGTLYTVESVIGPSEFWVNTAPTNGTGIALTLGAPWIDFPLLVLSAPAGGFLAGPLPWQTVDLGPNAPNDTVYTGLKFACRNADGIETGSPYDYGSFTIKGWQGVLGAETPNCTLSSAGPVYSLSADGEEQWQAVATGTTPNDPRFGQGQGILCATAVLAANISAWSSGASFNIQVVPPRIANGSIIAAASWTCTVAPDGVTVTGISPAVNPGAATTDTNDWVMIGSGSSTKVCLVASWSANGAGCILVGGSAAPTGSQHFATIEYRYGAMNGDNTADSGLGDTIWIAGHRFHLTTLSQGFVTSGATSGHATWTVTPQESSGPAINAGAYILDIGGGSVAACDPYAGELLKGATQAVSSLYNVGAPSAYTYLLVSEDPYGHKNTWPVIGQTPGLTSDPFGVEVQTIGSIFTHRLASTQLQALAVTTNLANLCLNPSFDDSQPGLGWTFAHASVQATGSSPAPHSGTYVGVLMPGGSGVYSQIGSVNKMRVTPGQTYTLQVWARSSGSPNGTFQLAFAYYLNGTYQTVTWGSAITPGSSAWTQYTLTDTVPSGVNQLVIVPGSWDNGTTGLYYVDDVSLVLAPNATDGISVDPVTGGLVFNGSTEFSFSGGQVHMANIDLSKASNFSVQFDLPAGSFTIIGIDADVIKTGLIQVGGSGRPSQAKFFDHTNALYSFIGDDRSVSGYEGAWFLRCGIGSDPAWTALGHPPDPLHPALYSDSAGNLAMSGSCIVGGSIDSTAFEAVGAGGIFTVNVDSTNGVKITDSSANYLQMIQAALTGAANRSGSSLWLGTDKLSITYSDLLNQAGQFTLGTSISGGGSYLDLCDEKGQLAASIVSGLNANGPSVMLHSPTLGACYGQNTVVSYAKPGGGSGTMTFVAGWLVAVT